ncbi:type II toxin-antitoxin system PemK/MazF family toxin [Microtetraspora sp. AC03309]|uniref:type II toxin-antitoxin system PemK/MazF family toxin n=1 Tax=Microtetraspora sp. AC03309 TaxID=2779376 RepID=UPI001E2D3A10|nr:type II toxin-antitoxin system PemK/MazF family toxin [Microtetraspora sp. AC03309]MCC5580789.1 type II toxin-antitoxin system PemK/MazF family toxin [Microtetraspora sp. AC03309]
MRDLSLFVTLIIVAAAVLAVALTATAKRRGRKPDRPSTASRGSTRGGSPGGSPRGRGAEAPSRRPQGRPTGRATGAPASSGRRRGEPSRGRPQPPDTGTAQRPGEIWWADVPFEDGPGSKVRPCVVLRTHRGGAEVLKITSQDQRHRDDHIEIPTRTWDHDADHNSFLDLSDPIRVTTAAFQDRAGELDPKIWRHVCSLHGIPR